MQAVILAAGRGTRMGKITETLPKPMVPILGKPLLEWKLDALPRNITEVVITIGYLGEQIQAYFGDTWNGKKLVYVVQETLHGTGGSLEIAKPFLQDTFLVTMGDDLYVQSDLEKACQLPWGILGLFTNQAEKFGLLAINEQNEMQAVTERPHEQKSGFVNIGAYKMGREFFSVSLVAISDTEFGLPQTLAQVTKTITIPVITATAWQPVGCPEDIPAAEIFIQKYYL